MYCPDKQANEENRSLTAYKEKKKCTGVGGGYGISMTKFYLHKHENVIIIPITNRRQ